MTRYSDAYTRAVGVELEPGSLNVVLEGPWVMEQPDARLEADEAGVGISLQRCTLNGLSCWILRTEKDNNGVGDHALSVLEIVSPLHLRTALGLHDGDDVQVEIERFGSEPGRHEDTAGCDDR
jgi:CTP-dependent riboflavin kinase